MKTILQKKNKGFFISKPFSIAPYNNAEYQIVIVTDRSGLKKLNKKFTSLEIEGNELAMVHTYYDGTKKALIIFNTDQIYGAKITADCIAHEATHVKNGIYMTIQQKADPKPFKDENEAYLIGYLTHIIFDFFIRTKTFDKIEFKYKEQSYNE